MRRMNLVRHPFLALLALTSVLCAGCSTRVWYDTLKATGESECRNRQPPGETEKCLARLNTMSYEDYERKRSGKE